MWGETRENVSPFVSNARRRRLYRSTLSSSFPLLPSCMLAVNARERVAWKRSAREIYEMATGDVDRNF